MSINLSALMKQRYDTAANWTAQNPTLLAGEIGIESDTKKWKVGTGSTAWTSLTYAIGGTYPIVNADIAAGAAIADTKLATIATAGKVSNSATTAASANTASAIVARDASGNFTAGTITAALTGAASSNVLKAGDTMTGVLAVTAGTAALPGIAVSGYTNTGIYSPGADQLAIATGGTSRLHVTSAGLVGIGTSSPGEKLSVVGGNISFDYGYSILSNGGFVQRKYLWSAYTTQDTLNFGVPGTYGGYGADATTARMTITQGGNVGIGTTSPAELLSLSGSSSFIGITNTTAAATNYIGTTSSGDFELNTGNAGDSILFKVLGTERGRFDTSGRLLVGTSNSGTSSATGQLRLGGTGAHSGSVLLSNASQSVANSGTVDITVGTSSIIIYVGFLIVNSMNSTSNASRTQTTFSIFASPQNSSFTATQIATATGAGSSTFTVTSPSAGVIRVTNTSGVTSDIAMCFMGTGGFMN